MLGVFHIFVSYMFLGRFLRCLFCSRSGVGRALKFILTFGPAMSEIDPAGNYVGAFPGRKVCVNHSYGLELNAKEGGGVGGEVRKSRFIHSMPCPLRSPAMPCR